MKKLLGGLVGLVVLTGIAMFLLVSNIDGIVKNVIETVGTRMTGTSVAVSSVQIDIIEGKGSILGLTIANPKGYPKGDALSFAELTLDLDIKSVNSQPVIIDQVVVDGTTVNYYGKGQDSNLAQIYNRMDQGGSSGGGSGSGGGTTAEGEDTLLIIDDFRFTNSLMTTEIEGVPEASRQLRIPDVTASQVGRAEGGVTPEQAAKEIIEPLLDQAIETAKNALEDEVKDRAKEEAKRQLMKKLQ